MSWGSARAGLSGLAVGDHVWGRNLFLIASIPGASGYSDYRPLLAVLPSYKLQYLKTENPHQQEKKSDNQRFFKVIVGRWCSKIPEEEKKAPPETKDCHGHED